MSKSLNISVLVAARDEYIEQLNCILCPLINQGFVTMYNDAFTITNGKNTIYKFQELLKDIPKWNQTILQTESKRIKKKCPYIMDIVTAIFVSNVKILASIRLSGDSDNIKIKIPTSDIFIHSIYIESANCIFYDPFLFYHRVRDYNQIQKNKETINTIIRNSINETIRQMIPFDNILQEYLKNALDDNVTSDSDFSSDSDSDSDSDSENDNNVEIKEIVNSTQDNFDHGNENNGYLFKKLPGEESDSESGDNESIKSGGFFDNLDSEPGDNENNHNIHNNNQNNQNNQNNHFGINQSSTFTPQPITQPITQPVFQQQEYQPPVIQQQVFQPPVPQPPVPQQPVQQINKHSFF